MPCARGPPACGRPRAAAAARSSANYQSTTVHLPPALATGNLDIITDAMVYEVTLGQRRTRQRRRLHRPHHAASSAHAQPASWSWPRAPASRCASCSTPRARSSPTGSPIRAAKSAATSWIRSAARWAGRCPCSRACRRSTRTARTGMQLLYALVALPGAARRQARLRARLSHRVRRRASACRATAPAAATRMAHRRQLREEIQSRTCAATTARSSGSTAAAR